MIKLNGIIKINIKDKESYKCKFNDERLSLELEEYIKSEMQMVKLKDKVTIEIYSDFEMDDKEKETLAFLIKNTYKDDIDEIRIYNKSLKVKDSLMLTFGTFLIIIYYFFENIKFVNEYLIIVGGFFIWKALENFMLLEMENRIKIKKKKQLLYSKIKFMD